jgi:hypothetical protein
MKVITAQTLLFAAGFGLASAVWTAAPALAAEASPFATAGSVRAPSTPPKRQHVSSRYRLASWYISRLRFADPAPSPPVLLMVGIAY